MARCLPRRVPDAFLDEMDVPSGPRGGREASARGAARGSPRRREGGRVRRSGPPATMRRRSASSTRSTSSPTGGAAGSGRRSTTSACELRRCGFEEATLWTLDANPAAKAFYEALGWEADGATAPHDFAGTELPIVRYRAALTAHAVTLQALTFTGTGRGARPHPGLPAYHGAVTASDQPLIEAAGVTKRFGHVTALDGVTADVTSPALGLLGANGAGKSTFMKAMLGLVKPDSGRVRVLGMDAAHQAREIRRLLGYMPENMCLPMGMTARDFIVHMGELRGLPRRIAVLQGLGGALPGGPRGGAIAAHPHVLDRHEAAHEPGPGDRALAQHGHPRRADERPRPVRARGDAGARPAALGRARDRRHHVVARARGHRAHV